VLKPTIFTKPNPSGGFGCIYANTNHSYYTLRDIINGYTIEYEYDHTPKRTKVKFKNINAIVNTAINVAKIFNDLNSKNNFFYSFYEEDLLVNIENGDVLLDISNAITRKDKEFTINKGCIYLAPELLNETTQPNQYTDSHTLAVLLFRIFFHNHPLEGKKSR
jgi:DNA-binding helix-hairpin-helix protein with protein kinase domain